MYKIKDFAISVVFKCSLVAGIPRCPAALTADPTEPHWARRLPRPAPVTFIQPTPSLSTGRLGVLTRADPTGCVPLGQARLSLPRSWGFLLL